MKGGELKVLTLEAERELQVEDLEQLQHKPRTGLVLQTLTVRHRRTAMLVAQGRKDHEVADLLDYTPARVAQLKEDPSFKELVAYYYDQIHEESLQDEKRFQQKLRLAGEQALNELNNRLDQKVEEINTSELRQIIIMAADRTVAPPKAANQPPVPQTITLNLGLPQAPEPKEKEPQIKTINPKGEDEGREP